MLYTTNKIYRNCSDVINQNWEKGLAAFIDDKFYTPVISKYSALYESELATFASIPLQLQGSNRMLLTSADRFIVFSSENKEASALLWTGIGRVETGNSTKLEATSVVKLQAPRAGSEKIVYCQEAHVLNSYTLFALVHLLHNSQRKILEGSLSGVSQAFLEASLKLTAYAFRKENRKVIKSPGSVGAEARAWFSAMAKKQEIREEVEKYEKYSDEVYKESFVTIMEKYYLAADFGITLNSVPAALKKYSTMPYNEGRLFDLIIDVSSSSRFPKKGKLRSEGPSFEMGEASGALSSSFPHAKGRDLAQGLIISYIVLMTTMTEKGLLAIEKTLPEAEKQYLAYLKTMLTVKAAFAPQLLTLLL